MLYPGVYMRVGFISDGRYQGLFSITYYCPVVLSQARGKAAERRNTLEQVFSLRQFEGESHEVITWLETYTPQYLPLPLDECQQLESVKVGCALRSTRSTGLSHIVQTAPEKNI